MPTEVNRKIATKTFNTPAGDIKVPVITEITFRDTVRRGQETTYTVDNSGSAKRDVHIAWVAHDPTDPQATENADPDVTPPSGLIAVERIDLWRVKDAVERGQEKFVGPDNISYNISGPPFFRTHLKTHVVSYRKDPTNPNDTSLISSELIDEFVVKDPVRRGQQTHFYLNNPQDDDAANAQITPDLPDITDTANGVDPPYRTDPFQNIVRLGGQPLTVGWAFKPQAIGVENPGQATGYHFNLQGTGAPASPPWNFTLSDGRQAVVAGSFPNVSDVNWTQGGGTGINFLAWPWWFVGPNTDTGGTPGVNQYTQSGGGTLTHTWPFFGYTYQFALAPAIFVPAGSLSVSFGPVTLTVDGIEWPCTSINASFTALPESAFGAAPNSMDFNPFFSATFEPP